MGFHRMLVQLTWAGVILSDMAAPATATATAFPSALPDCPDKCGEIQIPYPFGLTEGCYLKGITSFFINCTLNSRGEPLPLTGNVTVTNISIIQGQIDILMYNAMDCYNELERSTLLHRLPIQMSKHKQCSQREKCSGIGCCQMQIPGGLKNITLEAYSFKKHSFVFDFNPCSYAFIIREDKFKFSPAYLTTLQNNITLPMVLDWTIGSEKCDLSGNKSNYICGENSECVNPMYGSGYRCECKYGYRGNPYLKYGCQDIDECKEHNNCTNKQRCVNKPGSYDCLCKKGYHMDKLERECVRDQPAIPPSSPSTGQSSLAIYLAVDTNTNTNVNC
uniref:EGF-like domain-containing protein n=1 Tax=Quercus lobata TaxID=97700 RepID=A0A7N2MJN4_QUELO